MPIWSPAEPRQLVLAEPAEFLAGDDDPACARPLQPGDHHHQGRFARTRRADDADRLAGRHRQIDAAQDVDLAPGTGQFEMNVPQIDHQGAGPVAHAARPSPNLGQQALPGPVSAGYGAWRVGVNLGLLALLVLLAPAAWAAPIAILAFGDSLTAGYGLAQADGFPAQLQAALARKGIATRVVDGGVSGDTSAGGLARLDWSLADKPDLVILELGANDALRGLDPAATRGQSRRHPGAPEGGPAWRC